MRMLEGLPDSVLALADRNCFCPLEEIRGGYCSRVFADQTVVLKYPTRGEEVDSGYRCAPVLALAGGPMVIDRDEATGAVLMERFLPGTSLRLTYGTVDDLEVFCCLADQLQGLPTNAAMDLRDYYTRLPGEMEAFVRDDSSRVFLHGDLHHENILLDGEVWRPIDAKGLVGDPAFEAVAFLRNPIDLVPTMAELFEFTMCRLARLETRMGWSKRRMAGWLYIDRWAAVDDGSAGAEWVDCLLTFDRIRRACD